MAKYPCLTSYSVNTQQQATSWSNKLKLSLISSALILTLASCSSPSTAPKTTEKVPENKQVEQSKPDVLITAETLVRQSQTQDSTQARKSLIQASRYYLTEQQPAKALLLANQLIGDFYQQVNLPHADYESLSNAQQETIKQLLQTSSDFQSVLLTQAQAYWQLNNIELASKKTQQLSAIDKKLTHSLKTEYYPLAAQLAKSNNEPVELLYAQLQYLALTEQATEQQVNDIWQNLVNLPDWKLALLKQKTPQAIDAWLALLANAQRFGAEPEKLNNQISRWQQQFENHPAQTIAQQLISQQQMASVAIENIAVILPLSGKQKAAGEAAQQGILAAYQSDEQRTLHFIDSQKLEFSELNEELTSLNIDYVVGPLLKSRVNKYVAQTEIITPTLLLNVPSKALAPAHISAFSMRPEDEATQAAAVLSAKSFKHPLILSQRDNVSDRISQAFVKQWQKSTGEQPEVVHFERGQAMQREVVNSLGVEKSKARIKDLNARIKYSIKEEARNRRDIDMIYLVGGAQESSLVKPYIDVSISPFSELIPVYASSRSHSAAQEFGDANDLSGLMFTEMPWLLPSKQQEAELAKEVKNLWPKRSDGLQRIFAMGFDSFHLVGKLEAMKAQPYIRHYGQTGTLQLTENNTLTRSLLWARYRKDRIETFDID